MFGMLPEGNTTKARYLQSQKLRSRGRRSRRIRAQEQPRQSEQDAVSKIKIQGPGTYVYNASYLGYGDREDQGLRSAQAKSSEGPPLNQ
jgi:hypothetical protein